MGYASEEDRLPGKRPFDFAFRYEVYGDASSPQGLSELIIEIAPDGSGEIRYQDEGLFKHDELVAIFQPEEEQLDRLYRLMLAFGVLEPVWQPPRSAKGNPGSRVKLGVTCSGNFFNVLPVNASKGDNYLQPVYDAIRSLVPQKYWEKINQKPVDPSSDK